MLVEEIQAPQRWEPSDLHSPPACVACLAEDWEAVRPRTAGRHLHLCFGTVGPSPAICDPAGLALPIGLPLTPTTPGLGSEGWTEMHAAAGRPPPCGGHGDRGLTGLGGTAWDREFNFGASPLPERGVCCRLPEGIPAKTELGSLQAPPSSMCPHPTHGTVRPVAQTRSTSSPSAGHRAPTLRCLLGLFPPV